MPNRPSTVRILLAAAAVVPFSWPATSLGAEPAVPILTASRFLGPEGEDLGAERLAAAISQAGVPAKPAAGKGLAWRKPPADGTPWLCGATAGFGERAHAYMFWFNASGTPERLAHVPYGKTTLEGGARVWYAPIDAVADVVAHGSASQKVSGPAIRIKIVREEAKGEAGPVISPDVYELMSWAAACQAGWTPTPSAAPAEATLSVRAGVKSASLRLVIESEGRRRELVKRSVSEDDIHAVLRRMFSCLAAGSIAADFFQLGSGGGVVSTAPERLLCQVNGGLRAVDTGTFLARWGDGREPLAAAACVPWRTPDGTVELLQWRPQLARIDPADGRAKPLAPQAAAYPWSFDIDSGRVVIGSGTAVAMFKDAKEAWRHVESDTVTCGPILAGRLVVAGTGDGSLFALDAETKAVAWRLQLNGGLYGRPAVAGGNVVAYCREGESLVAVDTATGRKAWLQPLGDVLIGHPVTTTSGILVATKGNRVALLDPKTGRPRAERTLPGWIVDVVPLHGKGDTSAKWIAALTRNGMLTLLGATDLEPARSLRLDSRPGYGRAAGFIVAKQFPAAWLGPAASSGDGDEFDAIDVELESSMADRADCLLADDDEGYGWIIPLSRLLENH